MRQSVKKDASTLIITVAVLLSALLVVSSSTNAFAAPHEKFPNVHSNKIQYLVKTGSDSYYIQFKTCIGNSHVKDPTFAIKSDMDSKTVKYSKILMPNTCKVFETSTKAKHSNTIEVRLLNS